jgi:hypothetical protein
MKDKKNEKPKEKNPSKPAAQVQDLETKSDPRGGLTNRKAGKGQQE